MNIIYEPKARAAEYAPLAVNLYTGCLHACGYCYAPGVARKKRSVFRTSVEPRKNILEQLEKDCRKMKGDPREILLCFMTDAYQPFTEGQDITREALLILEKYEMKVTILTKGGMRAARDFDILKRNGWSFGTTIIFENPDSQRQWEPVAASLGDRVKTIQTAHDQGIRTWVSLEPVIDPDESLHLIRRLNGTLNDGIVDHWKIGKINYNKWYEDRVDWKKFLIEVMRLLSGKSYYIKRDLLIAAGPLGHTGRLAGN